MLKRKDIFSLLVIIGILLVFAGFSALLISNYKNKEDKEKEEEAVKFSWYINYEWFNDEWKDSLVAETITDKTGVSIDFKTPVGNASNTLDTLISSNELPDLITLGYWEPQLKTLIDNDMVYPLNELADKYDMEFYQVTNPDAVKWYTLSDGNIYAYPNSSFSLNDFNNSENVSSNQVFIVRKDIYEAIGSPDMTTPEGFSKAIRDAAERFPTVEGEKLIPIGANFFDDFGDTSFDSFLQNSLGVPYEKDGEYYNRNLDPEYLSWLKVFRQLNEEGYLSPDLFVDERTQIAEKILKGRYFCMFYQWIDMEDQLKEIYAEDPDRIYIAVDGPRNSNGSDPVLPTSSVQGWTVTLISRDCKDPEKAIKFMDFLLSEEGQKIIYLGVEGKTYEMKEGKPVLYPEVKELLETDRKAYNRIYGADDTYWMLQNNTMQAKWQQEPIPPVLQMKEYTYPYTQYLGQYAISIPEDTILGHKYEKLRNLWAETLKKLLLAKSDEDFDKIIEDYEKKSIELGMDDIKKEATRQIKEAKERLGIKE